MLYKLKISCFCQIVIVLMLLSVGQVFAADERIFFVERDSKDIQLIEISNNTPSAPQTVYTTLAESVSSISFDHIHNRMFFTDGSTPNQDLKYVYLNDPAQNPSYLVNRIEPIIYAIDPANNMYVIDAAATSSSGVRFSDSMNNEVLWFYADEITNGEFTKVKAFATTERTNKKVYFSTDSPNPSVSSRLWVKSDEAAPEEFYELVPPSVSDTNAAKIMKYDSRNRKLYAIADDSIFIYTLEENEGRDSIVTVDKIQYSDPGSSVNAADLLYTQGGVKLVLATTNDGLRLDEASPGVRTDLSVLVSLSQDTTADVVDVSVARRCLEGVAPDTDKDGIPDCKDRCPTDSSNQCEEILLTGLNPASDNGITAVRDFEGGFDPLSKVKIAGFGTSVIEQAAYDTIDNYVTFISDSGNSVYSLDLDTNTYSAKLVQNGAEFSGTIKHIAVDSFADTAYIVVDEGSDFHFYSFNAIDGTNFNPEFSVSIGMGNVNGIALDPVSNVSKKKRLFYSQLQDIYRKELGSPSPEQEVLAGPMSYEIGSLTFNHNDDELYFYSSEATEAAVYKVDASGTGVTANLLVSDQFSNGANSDVTLHYHSHIDNGNGSILMRNASGTPSDVIKINLVNTPSSFLALNSGYSFANATNLLLRPSCDLNRSLDSNLDGLPDCAELDSCLTDPFKLAAGFCGCGVTEDIADEDSDGMLTCQDFCNVDAAKVDPGVCGCGIPDSPTNLANNDGDSFINCLDPCIELHEDVPLTEAGETSCVPSGINRCPEGSIRSLICFVVVILPTMVTI